MKTRNKIISSAIFFALALTVVVSCQKDPFPIFEYGKIQGVVIDSKTNQPIEGVTISTNPGSSTVTTNAKGEYTIPDVKIGTVTINADKLNYTTFTTQVDVRQDQTTTANFSMSPASKVVGTVTLTGSLPDSNAVDVKSITTLSWKVDRQEPIDTITYQVTITDLSTKIQKVYTDIKDTVLQLRDLKFSNKYQWSVSAIYNKQVVASSSKWPFTTRARPSFSIFFSRSSDNGLYQIFATDPDSTYEELISGNYSKTAFAPVIYKNQNLILFTSFENNLPYVFGIFRDGTGIMKISPFPNMSGYSIGNGYSFYNHGNSILYTYMDRLYAINTDGTNNRQIATAPTNRQFTNVDWCPETGQIVVRTVGPMPYESEFYIMDNDGANMKLLKGGVTGMLESPSFSPDGKYLVYTQDVSGIVDITGNKYQSHIFLKNLADTTVADTDLTGSNNSNTSSGTNDLYPRFAPDNRQIVFVSRPNLGNAIGDIIKTDIINGTRTTIITNGTFPFWAN